MKKQITKRQAQRPSALLRAREAKSASRSTPTTANQTSTGAAGNVPAVLSRGQRKRREKRDIVERRMDFLRYCQRHVEEARNVQEAGSAVGDFKHVVKELDVIATQEKREAKTRVQAAKKRSLRLKNPSCTAKMRHLSANSEQMLFSEVYENIFAGGAQDTGTLLGLTTRALAENVRKSKQ
eukprot:Lankesteria_metandrocarpae@DN7894_c0_g1_i1.p1